MGNGIRKLRQDRGLTQKQLSEKSGVPRVCIARYEIGTFRPTLSNAEKLAAALGCSIEELLKKAG